ncbi:GNAT family N-acetyltransferase [Devosia chinhatensis]|uniref:N-acetyltransferase domain-containing protein n=1 Tax=Devosia chinhatensis TaxID=429727 RepID=A0A0F5FFM3_9HYPH|nr:GNAT family N-acetyltransferase [Devosia chinhatensis]KKB07646.1 hypothetical protein VE26_13235 [Devosia chinhatensis]
MRLTQTIRTPRLILRPPQLGDAEAIALYLNDFGVAGNLARVPHPYTLDDARTWLGTRRASTPPDEVNFAIEHAGVYTGQVGFHPGPDGPIIGYWLGRPFWGQGIMSEAVRASLDWLFAGTDVDVVRSGVFHFNAASLAIQNRLGFTVTGRSSLLCLARNAEVEHIDTKLTRERFRDHAGEAARPQDATH